MRKLKTTLTILGSLLLLQTSFAQNKKIAAFFPDYATTNINNLQYSKLTDIFFAFVFPNATGVIYSHDNNYYDVVAYDNSSRVNTKVPPLVQKAHTNNVKVHLAVGGHGMSWGFSASVANSTYRNKMEDSLVAMIKRYNLDGLNIDWEFPQSYDLTNFETFISSLRTKLNTAGNTMGKSLELSIAVGVGLFDGEGIAVNSSVFNNVDFIYLMAFDAMGDCYSCDPNNHSTLSTAEKTIKKWSTGLTFPGGNYAGDFTSKNAPVSKLVLGVPFYSRTSGNVVTNYNVFAATNTATYYNDADGILNGYTYNSCPMIQDKVNLIMDTYKGAGIWAWELDADRTDQYSLLGCAYTEMQTYMCTGSQPNLGNDVTICGGSATLNSGVSSGAGISFKWYKDNVLIQNATSSTYSASTAGTYKVIVTNNGCDKFDQIDVTVNTSLTTVGDTVCSANDIASLKVVTPGGPYTWYNASTNGTLLHTGSTYNVSIAQTTNFYVEGFAAARTSIGPKAPLNNPATSNLGWYFNYATSTADSLRLDLDVAATIDSIDIYSDYANANKTLKFTVYNSAGVQVGQTTYTIPMGSQYTLRIPIGISLSAGTGYKLTLAGTQHKLWYDGSDAPYPYVVNGIGTLKWGLASWGADGMLYPSMYNIILNTGANAGGCGRVMVKAFMDICTDTKEVNSVQNQVFPNPSNANFTVQLNNTEEVRNISVYDISGKLIEQLPVSSTVNFGENLNSGIYFLKISGDTIVENIKVVKN